MQEKCGTAESKYSFERHFLSKINLLARIQIQVSAAVAAIDNVEDKLVSRTENYQEYKVRLNITVFSFTLLHRLADKV